MLAHSHREGEMLTESIRTLSERSGKEPREIVDALIDAGVLDERHAAVQHIRFWGCLGSPGTVERIPLDRGLDWSSPEYDAALSALKIVAQTYEGEIVFQQVNAGDALLDVWMEFHTSKLRFVGIAAAAYAMTKEAGLIR